MVLVVNKWDTVDDKNDIKSYTQKMRAEFQFLSYVPIVFLSALTKKRLHTLMPEIIKVYENSRREIKTSVLNDVINDAYALNPAPSYKGKRLKIYFSAQTGTMPPKFTLNVNNKGLVHFSYLRYLENKIRENFDLEGTPGFFKDRKFRWNFKAHKGILIPIKENHRIIALRIHLEDIYNTDTTDIWFSSSQDCNGSKTLNNIMFLYPEENAIQFMNNTGTKDIIIVSEMILAYKIHLYFRNNIVIGVPNVISKKELQKLKRIQKVNDVHVVMDKHTVLHNSENLLENLYKLYPRRKIKLHFSLKDGEIPGSIENLNNYSDIQENIA